jgi:hypothetical protein
MLKAARRSWPGPSSMNICARSRAFRQVQSAAPTGVRVAAGAAEPTEPAGRGAEPPHPAKAAVAARARQAGNASHRRIPACPALRNESHHHACRRPMPAAEPGPAAPGWPPRRRIVTPAARPAAATSGPALVEGRHQAVPAFARTRANPVTHRMLPRCMNNGTALPQRCASLMSRSHETAPSPGMTGRPATQGGTGCQVGVGRSW